jgi:hypothetical protein
MIKVTVSSKKGIEVITLFGVKDVALQSPTASRESTRMFESCLSNDRQEGGESLPQVGKVYFT